MTDPENLGLQSLEEVLEILSATGRSVRTITLHPDGKIQIEMGFEAEPNALDRWRREKKSYQDR